jgi:hypothetical protein
MRFLRAILIALLLLSGIADVSPVAAQEQEEPEPVDIAAIPAGPDDIPEDGYLVEGGGFLDGAGQVIRFHAVDTLNLTGLQRSYMYRLMLVADRTDPGSTLLADQITLVHEFASTSTAAVARDEFDAAWKDAGDAIEGDDDTPTYRVVVDSADSLVSVISRDNIVIEVMSTDFQRRPDVTDHEAVVAATSARMRTELEHPQPGLAGAAIAIDTMKALTFFDSSDAYQHYTVQDGALLSFAQQADSEVPDGLETAFTSQQVVMLNTGSEIVLQLWLGDFASAAAAEDFAGTGTEMTGVRDKTPDGLRASGFTTTLVADSTVARITLLAGGDALVSRTAVSRMAGAQLACLADREQLCPILDLADVLTTGESTPEPTGETAEGVFASEMFPWRVDYGAAGWDLQGIEGIEGVDYLDLVNGRSLATIETVVDRHGDPQTCILENIRLLQEFEEHAVIDLGSDVEGERKAGKETGHAWAVYTVEPLAEERADQEYTIRYDCYTLVEGNASLVVTHTAPRDLWAEESAKGDDLRAEIEIDGAAAGAAVDVDVMVRTAMKLIVRIWIPLAA